MRLRRFAMIQKKFAFDPFTLELPARRLFWAGRDVDDDTVRKTVRSLARKLGDTRKNQIYIETTQHRGYRWICPVRELDIHTPDVKESDQAMRLMASLPL